MMRLAEMSASVLSALSRTKSMGRIFGPCAGDRRFETEKEARRGDDPPSLETVLGVAVGGKGLRYFPCLSFTIISFRRRNGNVHGGL